MFVYGSSEVGYIHNEHDALQRQLEIKRPMLEEKMERAVIGEALVAKCEVDFLKLEEVIPEAKHEIIVLVEEENQSQNNLKT